MLSRINRAVLKIATFLTFLTVAALLMGASEARANWSQASWGDDPSVYSPEIVLTGGTVSDTETVTTFQKQAAGLDRYVFSMTGNAMSLYNRNDTASLFLGQYSLTATFTTSGQYLGGTLSIFGSAPGQKGITLLAQSTNLQLMGLWGDNSSGGFEFMGVEDLSANSYFKQFEPDVYVMATSVYISNSSAFGPGTPIRTKTTGHSGLVSSMELQPQAHGRPDFRHYIPAGDRVGRRLSSKKANFGAIAANPAGRERSGDFIFPPEFFRIPRAYSTACRPEQNIIFSSYELQRRVAADGLPSPELPDWLRRRQLGRQSAPPAG